VPPSSVFTRFAAAVVGCSFLLAILLIPARTFAKPVAQGSAPEQPRISVQLNTPDGTLPDYLCILGGAGIATVPLDAAFEPSGTHFKSLAGAATDPKAAALIEEKAISKIALALQGLRAPTRPEKSHYPHEDEIAAARAALGRSVKAPEPACDRSLCDARFEFPSNPTMRLACRKEASSPPMSGERPRVVVIALQFYVDGGTQPQITNLEYDKKGVVDLDAFLPRNLVTAKVVGGHYTVGTYSQSEVDAQGHHRVSLTLTPLCTERDVALSDLGSVEGRVKVSLDVARASEAFGCGTRPGVSKRLLSIDAEVRPERTVRLLLPVGLDGEKQLRIESRDPNSAAYFRALVAWSALEPPSTLSPRFEAVSFRWRRHCSFPNESSREVDCPTASLPETDIECTRTKSSDPGVCAYRCERSLPSAASANAQDAGLRDFSLPTVVQLSSEKRAWDAMLLRPNMLLTAYLGREEEFVRVRFLGWNAADVRAAWSVDLELPSGEHRTLWTTVDEGADTGPIVELAGACNADVRYQLSGDRRYVAAVTKVEHGILRIPRPGFSARIGRLRGRLGFAESFEVGQSRAEWEGQKRKNFPQFRAELGVNLRPRNWDVSFEPHVGIVATSREYYGIRRDTTAKHPVDTVAYLNFILGGTLYVHPARDFAVGASFQFRWGTPLHSDDRVLVGGSDLVAGPGLALVYQAWPAVAVWVDGFYLRQEQIYAFETNFRGQPSASQAARSTAVVGAGATLGIF
jgi:hypothetical protein